ncbi:response regulator transcription factor [Stenotrophomonas sp. MMGLT7]|nr:response regulator transcription factor [Stenotrophomonas sp. MMGLT7]
MRLLLVEDDQDIAETLTHFLAKQGFVVDLAPTLAIARAVILDNDFDLVLLDRRLPDGDGLSLIAFARSHNRPQRIILLTALADVDAKVDGLESGAHDYIAKPFEPRELLARIRNALRHGIASNREVKRFGPLAYDVENRAFWVNDEPLALRRTEALVLAALMARPGVLVPRESLEARVYGYDRLVNSNSLESQISRLRKNLAEKTGAIRIHSVRGMGYSLIEE